MTGVGRWIVWMGLLPLLASCSGGSSAAAPTVPGSAASGGLHLGGEHFTVRTVVDERQHMPVFTFVAPEQWRDKSEVTWDYSHVSEPWSAWSKVESPSSSEAVYIFPNLGLFWLAPGAYFRPGQSYNGWIYAQPLRPADTLAAFAKQLRGRQPGFEVVGSKALPGLPDAIHLPGPKQFQGIGLKVRYQLDGKPVEEEFYAAYYQVKVPYDGPQGRTWQTDWGLKVPHSFRAPAGTLDARREVFAAIPKSIRRNPAWIVRVDGINKYLGEQFNRQLQAGYDQIAAAGRLSRQLAANSDAMLASIDAGLAAGRTGGGGAAGGRSANDRFDDNIRGVDTMDDPYYGTSQHSNGESYHWTDGYGGYRNTNDPGANPSVTESGSWTLMQPSR